MDQQLAQTSQFCQVFGGSTSDFDYGHVDMADNRPFAIVDGEIVNWCCMCGRFFVTSAGKTAVQPGTSAWLEITHPSASGGFSLDVVMADAKENTDDKTYLKLYEFDSDGLVRFDYRGVPTMPFYN